MRSALMHTIPKSQTSIKKLRYSIAEASVVCNEWLRGMSHMIINARKKAAFFCLLPYWQRLHLSFAVILPTDILWPVTSG
jgi:hypothetical protein